MTSGSPREAARWLKERQRPALVSIRLAALAGAVAALATIVQLAVIAWIAHGTLVEDARAGQLLPLAGMVLVALLVRSVATGYQNHRAARASDEVRGRLRQELLDHMGASGPVQLARQSAGTLATEWIDQVDALHGYYAHYLPQMILCVVVPVMILVTVVWLDWLAALFLLLSAPLIPLFMALVGMGAEKLNQQHMETLGRLSGHFLDQLRGLTTLQLFQYTGPATEGIARATEEYRRINLKTLRVAFLSSAVLEFFASVAIAVIAIYIGFGLLGYIQYGPSPDLTLFSGLFILLLAPEFFQPLRQLAQHYHDRATALGAAAQLRTRLDDRPHPGPDVAVSGADVTADTAVHVHQLTVTYPDDRRGLDGVSLAIRAGELVLLEGPSGSGKTTLLNAMAGFLAPSAGHVSTFGQQPGGEPFGWLGQTPFVRADSWAGNLRLAAPDATDDELLDALARVGLGKLVSNRPDGVDTAIREGGAGLSGGQARRLALARLFLARHRLVLMDEPTAGLDARSEQQVIDAIRSLRDLGTTIVIASHHQALKAVADRRLALADGRLAGG
ncbi:thiol reductant ABC exporter subunit CydD [Marinobacter sp. OP 3.4]|uniref:thiol reductant ABC exporter subunit CydD n=1 Tax=Marinobacter sp. OP 3.4 TaxID=3076501 RepID=UPI002E1F7FEA